MKSKELTIEDLFVMRFPSGSYCSVKQKEIHPVSNLCLQTASNQFGGEKNASSTMLLMIKNNKQSVYTSSKKGYSLEVKHSPYFFIPNGKQYLPLIISQSLC